MAKGQLPGKAHHDVPGLAGVSKVKDQDQDSEKIVAGEKRRDQRRKQQNRQQHQSARRRPGSPARDHAALLPMMPCGRNSSTSTRMAKANMLLAEGVKRSPARASVSPIRTPPMSAPGIEPRPPVMTITKASSV